MCAEDYWVCPTAVAGKSKQQRLTVANARLNREERMLNFIKEFQPGPEDNVDYVPGVGHNTTGMFSSDAGVQRLL